MTPSADLVIALVALDNPKSLHKLEVDLLPKVENSNEGVPIIVVATKTDLSKDKEYLTKAKRIAKDIFAEGPFIKRLLTNWNAEF
jgi:hypothetical protein